MRLFQCDNCGCIEEYNLASQGFSGCYADCFDWDYNPSLKGKTLCSACGPVLYRDKTKTPFGKWHGMFPREYLTIGKFVSSKTGGLVHKYTGEDYRKYILIKE